MMYENILKLANLFLSLAQDYDVEEYEDPLDPGANEERRARDVSRMFPREVAKFHRDLRESNPEYKAEKRRAEEARRAVEVFEWAKQQTSPEGLAAFNRSLDKTYDLLRDSGIEVTRNQLRDAKKAGDDAKVAELQAKLDRLLDKSLSSYEATRTPKELELQMTDLDSLDF